MRQYWPFRPSKACLERLFRRAFCVLPALLIFGIIGEAVGKPVMGPLEVCKTNPRYFDDGTGKVVYLTGSHTWGNFIDNGHQDPPNRFDYIAYLDFLQEHNHNFFRLWTWEQAKWAAGSTKEYWFAPSPYQRLGPQVALDGKPKFDLTRFNEAYFDRLRRRVVQAYERGIYVSVMLFNGWTTETESKKLGYDNFFIKLKKQTQEWLKIGVDNPWRGHPFNRYNNLNGLDGDSNGDGGGEEVHTLKIPEVTRLQEAYVKKALDTLNDLDNVVWEVSNESSGGSQEWQYHIINFIKSYEAKKPNQHPVGMTAEYPNGSNYDLFASPADWISPNHTTSDSYRDNPPIASGTKVIITDTDHLWGIGGDVKWVWKSFLRGHNPIFMDPYNGQSDASCTPSEYRFNDAKWIQLRRSLGYTLNYANRINLVDVIPHPELSSTGYCLANPGFKYLIYQPVKASFAVDLLKGTYYLEWFDPKDTSKTTELRVIEDGKETFFPPSHIFQDAVLYLVKQST